MAKLIKMNLNTDTYKVPTNEDIKLAKQYVLRRSGAVDEGWALASDVINDAVEELVRIAYKYNIPAERFSFDSSVSQSMMDEVTEIMDRMDEEIYEILVGEALACSDDENERDNLLSYLQSLGHRNMDLRQTMHAYEWRMLHQVGGLIAAALFAGLILSSAIKNIQKYVSNVRQNPYLGKTSKYKQLFVSPFVRNNESVGFPDGSHNIQGVPFDGYNAIKQIYGIAIAQIWMKNQLYEMQESGCAGYYQLRGSEFPCALCDDEVGFHEGVNIDDEPFPHPHCMCYRVPIYRNGEIGESASGV